SLRKDAVGHSGAGRIAKLRMRTMTLAETGESSATVSLAGLFEGRFETVLVQQHLAPLADIICRGGWPALHKSDVNHARKFLDSYLDAVFETSIPKRGLNGGECRRVARSLARNTGAAVKLETIAADAFAETTSIDVAKRKVSEHIDALESLYLIEAVTGWDAPIRSKSRMRVKPK